jgi:glycerol-3-phosphate O-acyltransferase
MLSMTVRSYLRSPSRPIMFQPIYVGYERLVEGNSYTAELSGQPKESESLRDLLKVFGVLKQSARQFCGAGFSGRNAGRGRARLARAGSG